MALGITACSGGASLACSSAQPQTQAATEIRVEPTPSAPTSAACSIAKDGDGGVASGSLDCCLAATKAAVASDGGRVTGGAWVASRPDLVACCDAIEQTGRLVQLEYSPRWSTAACFTCEEATQRGRSACTPWGPPTPPAMMV